MGYDRSKGNYADRPAKIWGGVFKRQSEGLSLFIRESAPEFIIRDQAGEYGGDYNVEDSAYYERRDYAYRQVSLGVPCLFGHCRHGIESYVREKDYCGTGAHTSPAVGRERSPIACIHPGEADHNEECQNQNL